MAERSGTKPVTSEEQERIKQIEQRLEGLTDNGDWKVFHMDTAFGPKTASTVVTGEHGGGLFPMSTSNHRDGELIAHAPDDIRFLLAALRTREAETWAQAAQVVNSKSVPDFNSWLVGPAEVEHELRLRARAAQPQEPTT